MESSPLSVFEAVFKVIEERPRFGRQIVTLTASLMAAVMVVFCVTYLWTTLGGIVVWAMTPQNFASILGQKAIVAAILNVVVWVILGFYLWRTYTRLRHTLNKADTVLENLSTAGGNSRATARCSRAIT